MIRSRKHRSRGQSLAEFSLAIPLFLFIVVAIAEGGYFVVASTMVSSATHEGARTGILQSTSSGAVVRSRVQEAAAPIVTLANGDIRLALKSGGFSTDPCDNACYADRRTGDRLKVTTSYTHTPLVGYVFRGIAFPANAEAELRVEGDGS